MLWFVCFVEIAAVRATVIGIVDQTGSENIMNVAQTMKNEINLKSLQFVQYRENLTNVYEDMRKVARWILNSRAEVIVGSYHDAYMGASQLLSVPYVVTERVTKPTSNVIIQLSPTLETFVAATKTFIAKLKWPQWVAIFYEFLEGSTMVENLFLDQTLSIQAHNLVHTSLTLSKHIDDMLKKDRQLSITHFVIIATPEKSVKLFQRALYFGMLSIEYHWLVINTHQREIIWTEFLESESNIKGLKIVQNYSSSLPYQCGNSQEESLVRDAVYVSALLAQNVTHYYQRFTCDKHCSQFSSISGCTGILQFTASGQRNDEILQIFTLRGMKEKIKPGLYVGHDLSGLIRGIHYKYDTERLRKSWDRITVVTIIEKPFVQYKSDLEPGKPLSEQLEGFLIDVLNEMSVILKFKYTIYLSPDGKYGSKKPTGWTGMIRELIEERAHIALAAFSITPERAEVVDFTSHYMIKGTSTVIREPVSEVSIFQFLAPFSSNVWISVFAAYIVVSISLVALARFNADKHENVLYNTKELFWYIWGTLLRGSVTVSPQAISSRILVATWWFFSLIMISVYTANLAAFLTVTNVNVPMTTSADLSSQNIYQYGTVEGSQIQTFFENTKLERFSKMWAYMKVRPESMVRRVEHGIHRATQEKYAFIWDSPTLQYLITQNCSLKLMEVGSPFDLKGYGFPTTKGNHISDFLDSAILQLSDQGKLSLLQKKWWRKTKCSKPKQSASSTEIKFRNASGFFLVLGAGVLLSIIYCFVRNSDTIFRFFKSPKKVVEDQDECEIPMQSQNHCTATSQLN